MSDDVSISIGTYEYIDYRNPADAFREYDPVFTEVARLVAAEITRLMPAAVAEHVGSSAVPGCAGKGVVDLMVNYPSGRLVEAREAVDRLGFQRQTNRDPFPEDRPCRVGTVVVGEVKYRLHVHVIAADSQEAAEQLRFRNRLRADPALMNEYVARKREVLIRGVGDSIEYNDGKAEIITRVLKGDESDIG